ncbi:MAG: NADH-quinone oxidoreductase subunit K [Anaerolineae bacterium]|nr:NADH-quinone oxidoreductase subunit K [Anaerolineae bacterium]
MITPLHYLALGATLFVLGLLVVAVRRERAIVLLGLELALQGVNLSVAALTSHHQDWEGRFLLLTLIAVSAVELVGGLALVARLAVRRSGDKV